MTDPVVVTPHDSDLETVRSAALETLPEAAAVLDGTLTLRQANTAFLSLCAAPRAGAPLSNLLRPMGAPPPAPADGQGTEYLARAADGQIGRAHV